MGWKRRELEERGVSLLAKVLTFLLLSKGPERGLATPSYMQIRSQVWTAFLCSLWCCLDHAPGSPCHVGVSWPLTPALCRHPSPPCIRASASQLTASLAASTCPATHRSLVPFSFSPWLLLPCLSHVLFPVRPGCLSCLFPCRVRMSHCISSCLLYPVVLLYLPGSCVIACGLISFPLAVSVLILFPFIRPVFLCTRATRLSRVLVILATRCLLLLYLFIFCLYPLPTATCEVACSSNLIPEAVLPQVDCSAVTGPNGI